MPREQINYPNINGVIILDGNELEYEEGAGVPEGGKVFPDPALHVNWQASGADYGNPHVQLSLQMPAGFLRARAEGLHESTVDTWIYSPALTREELNKLIRTLRNARDKAFGRDE